MSICNDEKSKNITVYLHKECTLNCSFCFQHYSKFMTSLPKLDFDAIYNSIKQVTDQKSLNINFTGGELFYSNEVIDKLINLISKLKQEYDLKIVPSSNLICNMDICKKFIDYLYSNDLIKDFSTSFDFKNRFKSEEIIALWYKNYNSLQEFYPNLNIITNTIITNETYEAFIENKAEYNNEKIIFNELYKQNKAIALQLLSVYKKEDYISDEKIKALHDYFKTNFPRIVFLYNGYGKQCSYNQTCIIYGDGKVVKGCYENNYGEKIDLDEIKKLYIKSNECAFCKRYGYCQHECYMEWYARYRNNLKEAKCFYKIIGEV